MRINPPLLMFRDGTPVESATWPLRRAELLDILQREQYGYAPAAPASVCGEILHTSPCCAGHARLEQLRIAFDTPKGEFSFPMFFFCPTDGRRHPLFILLNFSANAYDAYFPAEEIIDNGFALAVIPYTSVTSDDPDMTNGLSGCYPRENPSAWGKIAMWGWAASRAADYLLTRPEVDGENIAVIGHSRLGKAALVCGAMDERFRFTFANDSGCGGDAPERGRSPGSETLLGMNRIFPHWLCDNCVNLAENPEDRPLDQHFLMAAIAPRFVAVCGAEDDQWADPYGGQRCCAAASEAWELLGMPGYIGPEDPAKAGEAFLDGSVGYALRDGIHFLSRQDWLVYMKFMKAHLK